MSTYKTDLPIMILALLVSSNDADIKYRTNINGSIVEYTTTELLGKTVADIILLAKNGVEYTITKKDNTETISQ